MSFVVDTDVCSAYLEGDRRASARFMQYGGICISVVTLAEPHSWALRSPQAAARVQAVEDLCAMAQVLPVDASVALRCGQERAALLDRGVVVPVPDMLSLLQRRCTSTTPL